MGLKPLEFSDCYLDSPYFRDFVYEHEKELESTNERIKGLIKECKNLLRAVDSLSKAQRSFCNVLKDFKLNYIGEIDRTDKDEIEIADAFEDFAELIGKVEEERERMLIKPLEKFRKEQIGAAKDGKRKYDEETKKFCSNLEKYLQLKNKTKDELLKEADKQTEDDFKNFQKLAFVYVSKLQEVNETKKFEFIEILLGYIYGQKTFYHNGHECYTDSKDYLDRLSLKLQKIRERYEITQEETEDLKKRVEKQGETGELQKTTNARRGYLFVQEKKHGGLVFSWTKHYCMYQKENKILTMIPYSQTMGKMSSDTNTFIVSSCTRKPTEPLERRFCFEITGNDRKDIMTLQALSDEDRRCWLEVMDGHEPIYMASADLLKDASSRISAIGITFIKKCISAIENTGIEEEGLYRIAGVSSKFNNLVKFAIESRKAESLDFESENPEYDLRTITSGLKQYFRNLSEPILTYVQHEPFLDAIKEDIEERKIEALRSCLSKLPDVNYNTLKLLMAHLVKVANHSDKNRMQASNIGVVWGPTLMRPRDETMAALMNLKYQGVVIETLIKEYDKIFTDDAARKPTELTVDKSDAGRSPNLQRKPNGPIGISNPAYNNAKPLVQQRPPPSQKSYPAPLPPGNKPTVLPKKNRHSKQDGTYLPGMFSLEAEFEDWTFVSDAAVHPGGPKKGIGITPQVHRASSTPILSQNEAPVNQKSPYSPKQGQNPKVSKPDPPPKKSDPPPKKFVESVAGFTSVSKTDTVDEQEEHDYENADNNLVKRNVSFERALKKNPRPVVEGRLSRIDSQSSQTGPMERKKLDTTSPPPIPRRKEWKVRAIYNCVGENSSELSFTVDAIITNVKKSTEDGWLTGTLNGRTGLLPENYVVPIEQPD
eukprot:gene7360-8180_t